MRCVQNVCNKTFFISQVSLLCIFLHFGQSRWNVFQTTSEISVLVFRQLVLFFFSIFVGYFFNCLTQLVGFYKWYYRVRGWIWKSGTRYYLWLWLYDFWKFCCTENQKSGCETYILKNPYIFRIFSRFPYHRIIPDFHPYIIRTNFLKKWPVPVPVPVPKS